MKKVKQSTANKIGLFSAVMVIFGAIVGVGIFFKNISVFEANNNNWLGVLLSWIITIVMAMCMAISFAEAGTCRLKNKSDGLGGWASCYCGNQFGRYVKVSHSLNYFPVIITAISVFTGEACLNCFGAKPGVINYGNLSTLYVFLIGLGFLLLFVFLNLISTKAMGRFNDVAGIIKFIPIIAVVLLGIIFGLLNANGGLWNQPSTKENQFSITGVIGSIPAILFAFEGYTIIGSISGDMKDPERNVPLSIVIAMAIISLINIAITVGCITAGTGNVYELMNIVFKDANLAKIFKIIMSIFLFICILGVLNALIYSGVRGLQANCINGTLFKGKDLANAKASNPVFAGSMYLLAICGFWLIGLGIPSSLLNVDDIADGSTNTLIIYFYILYAVILLGSFRNRFTKKVTVNKIKIFPVTCVISIICCLFIFGFCGIYQNIINPIMRPMSADISWGLFIEVGHVLCNWQIAIIFWCLFTAMACLPLINDLLIKGFDHKNKQPLIWQHSKQIILK